MLVFSEILEMPLNQLTDIDELDYVVHGIVDLEESKITKNNRKYLFKYFSKITESKDQKLLCDIAKLLTHSSR